MLGSVIPIMIGAITATVVLVLGAVIGRHLRSTRDPALTARPGSGELLPLGVGEVIARLPSAAAVIDAEDGVLQSTTLARTLGVVRGNRVAVAELLALVRAGRRDGVVLHRDIELDRPVGAVFLSARVAPLHGGLMLMLCEDTTPARRVENTRKDFVANISHELKTPIGAISLLAEAVEQAADDPAAVRQFSRRMITEAERLTTLVSQVIRLSRLQADEPLTQAEPVDIDEVVTGAVDRCRVDADRRDISLTRTGEEGCQVLGDVAELETAVGNLVENAIAYSDPGARVVVAVQAVPAPSDAPTGRWVEISVSDNGIGIAADDLDRVFERFYRVDFARSRANGGTGLGLSIVKHAAAVHGGRVDVWSRPGQGSTFSIALPAMAPRPAGAQPCLSPVAGCATNPTAEEA